jgi:hypothetical protein
MRSIAIRVGIAAITFTIGIALTSVWFFSRRHSPAKLDINSDVPAQLPAKQGRTIVGGMSGKGISADGYPTSFSNHDYSDGTYIHQLSVFYKSPRQANAEMQKHLKDALEIIRQQPFLDEKGVQVGELVVATFAPYSGSSVVWPELLWTEGSRYVTQRRSSLQSILNDLDANR